jgi:hypothetical protein
MHSQASYGIEENKMHHEPCAPNEIFVGNTKHISGIETHLTGLTTARLGKVAFDLNVKSLPSSYMLPMFVGRSEANRYDQIMDARLSAVRGGRK